MTENIGKHNTDCIAELVPHWKTAKAGEDKLISSPCWYRVHLTNPSSTISCREDAPIKSELSMDMNRICGNIRFVSRATTCISEMNDEVRPLLTILFDSTAFSLSCQTSRTLIIKLLSFLNTVLVKQLLRISF